MVLTNVTSEQCIDKMFEVEIVIKLKLSWEKKRIVEKKSKMTKWLYWATKPFHCNLCKVISKEKHSIKPFTLIQDFRLSTRLDMCGPNFISCLCDNFKSAIPCLVTYYLGHTTFCLSYQHEAMPKLQYVQATICPRNYPSSTTTPSTQKDLTFTRFYIVF